MVGNVECGKLLVGLCWYLERNFDNWKDIVLFYTTINC